MKIKFAVIVLIAALAGAVGGFYLSELSREEFVVTPTPSPTPTQISTPVKLLCLDSATRDLRSSDVAAGCFESEQSMGATAIVGPLQRPLELNSILKIRFLAAQAAAEKVGYRLAITSGFRPKEYQAMLFRNAVKKYGSEAAASKWVLPAELSHHPWGLAIDVNYPNDPVSTKWLEKNGYEYGLCRAYENEWWHFEGLTAPGQQCPPTLLNASTIEGE